MSTTAPRINALPAPHRERLMSLAREVSFRPGERLFDEHQPADRFWVVKTGAVILDAQVPGRRPAEVEMLGHGDLVGLSWLFPPYEWELGAEAMSLVRAWEFDAVAVRDRCASEAGFGFALTQWAAEVLAHRLQATRARLIDLYVPRATSVV
ncbi:cyclic nucleotide-binding domain-containing protein [Streptomyces sp. MUM 203J]|uniref:cyclic nucleotide-binding domain-containing protein n=1 Tax=Streptomyces sp. MUM 203J TaxID=2791990 RepID=UPI001F035448|nr:cyclic nucleotide-binding domain-containing protein [Streptomyces sp. MUM 203J]MCH0540779.1 cyclic nucleotide-binding domain-containing protein [Streptomyces sp. MUM 203J]